MADDPWPAQHPQQPESAQAQAPSQPGFGVPPVRERPVQPRSAMAYDPELAPPPDARSDKRLLWVVGVLTVLLACGIGFAFYLKSQAGNKEIKAAKTFLSDVQGHRYTAAYGRLCAGTRAATPPSTFTSKLQAAAARGHGLRSFDVVSGNSSQLLHGGPQTVPVAQANVTFTNGHSGVVTLLLGSAGGQLCVLDPGTDLY